MLETDVDVSPLREREREGELRLELEEGRTLCFYRKNVDWFCDYSIHVSEIESSFYFLVVTILLFSLICRTIYS